MTTTTTTRAIGEWRVSMVELPPDPTHPYRFRVLVHYYIGDKMPLYFCPIGKTRADTLDKLRRLVEASRSISPRERADILTAVEDVPAAS